MLEFSAPPRLARLVLEAERQGCLAGGARLAALRDEGCFEGGDILEQAERTRLDEAAAKLRDRFLRDGRGRAGLAARAPSAPKAAPKAMTESLAFAVLCGFPDRVVRKRRLAAGSDRGGVASGPRSELIFSSGGSAMLEETGATNGVDYFVALDVEERQQLGSAKARVMVRALCPIRPEWLFDLEPVVLKETEELTWLNERVEAVARLTYDQLVLSESRGAPRDPVAASSFLAEKILTLGLARICDPEALARFRARLVFLGIQGFADSEQARWLSEFCAGKNSLTEAREGAFLAFLHRRLSSEQSQRLEKLAPETVPLSRGRRCRVHYETDKPPWIESRLQDFFGMTEGPAVLGGKVLLTLHLLAPNQRAVQVTNDLRGFWQRGYREVRRELSRRYPRHAWPENPVADPVADPCQN